MKYHTCQKLATCTTRIIHSYLECSNYSTIMLVSITFITHANSDFLSLHAVWSAWNPNWFIVMIRWGERKMCKLYPQERGISFLVVKLVTCMNSNLQIILNISELPRMTINWYSIAEIVMEQGCNKTIAILTTAIKIISHILDIHGVPLVYLEHCFAQTLCSGKILISHKLYALE